MNKILTGGKAKVFVNGIELKGFDSCSVEIREVNQYPEVVDYIPSRLPYHECKDCGSGWTFSTNDSECLECGGTRIEHVNED